MVGKPKYKEIENNKIISPKPRPDLSFIFSKIKDISKRVVVTTNAAIRFPEEKLKFNKTQTKINPFSQIGISLCLSSTKISKNKRGINIPKVRNSLFKNM